MIGIDVAEIARFREMQRFDAFLQKVFTEEEIAYLRARDPFECAAGLWAAKEAVAKALGKGFSQGLSPKSVVIGHTETGAPFAVAEGMRFEVSISHEKSVAVAVAMKV